MKIIGIEDPKGIMPACDVPLEKLGLIAEASNGKPRIRALKVGGITPTLTHGLSKVVETIREYTDITIVFDYQKAGNDIPDLGKQFAGAVKAAGVDEVIIFPFGGAETEQVWIQACLDEGLGVIVGGHMTQKKFLATEGGFINDPKLIYAIAVDMGIRHFIVPGNKVEFVSTYHAFLRGKIPGGRFRLSAPGFLAQGGVISDTGRVAGDNWDAIVGRDITKHDTVSAMKNAIDNLVSQITA